MSESESASKPEELYINRTFSFYFNTAINKGRCATHLLVYLGDCPKASKPLRYNHRLLNYFS